MTAADVERLYTAVQELRAEIHGYRAELNGRLRVLEMAEAQREGAVGQRSSTARILFGAVGMAAAISAVMAFLLEKV